MADDITDTVSTVPKMPEIPPRKSDRYAKSYIYMSETTTQPPLNSIELNRLYFSNFEMWNVSETTTL